MTEPFTSMTIEEAEGFMATKGTQRVRDVIIERVKGKTVLDIGCGHGIGVELMCPDPKNYLGIDCSRALVSRAKADHTGYDFVCIDVRNIRASMRGNKPYEYAVLKSVLEHQESLEDAIALYDFALGMAKTVLVAWHTPPIYSKTEIIQVNACDLNNPLYQNHYERGSFNRDDVRLEVERVDEFILWIASRI
jgi:trans-aconitate methyltransferase